VYFPPFFRGFLIRFLYSSRLSFATLRNASQILPHIYPTLSQPLRSQSWVANSTCRLERYCLPLQLPHVLRGIIWTSRLAYVTLAEISQGWALASKCGFRVTHAEAKFSFTLHALAKIERVLYIGHALFMYVLRILRFHSSHRKPAARGQHCASLTDWRSAVPTYVCRGFPPSLQIFAGMVPPIRPWPLSSTSFPIHNSPVLSFDAVYRKIRKSANAWVISAQKDVNFFNTCWFHKNCSKWDLPCFPTV
jgi:hypothetical protein